MSVKELEKCYLSCLFNGAAIQDLVIRTPPLERVHQEIKRLRENGNLFIPKVMINDAQCIDYDENRNLVDYYVARIKEEYKQSDIKGAVEKAQKNNKPSDDQISDLREELNKIAEISGKMDIISTEELRNKDYDNTEFIVEKLIPVGLTILMGDPKKGKSWLLLLLADAISLGVSLFGFKTHKVPVLYFTLEDNAKRCKYRLGKLKERNVPWNNNFYLCERVNNNTGIINGIKKTGARVVIIDTFGAFATDIKDGNNYHETTKAIRQLKEIADNYQVAIIAVFHTRKNKNESSDNWTSEIIESQGWIGAADTIIGLYRQDKPEGDSKVSKGHIKIKGRDIPDSMRFLKLNDGCWEVDHEEEKKRKK